MRLLPKNSSLERQTVYPRTEYLLQLPVNLEEKDTAIFSDIQRRVANQVDAYIFKNVSLVTDSIIYKLKVLDQLTHALKLKPRAKFKRLVLGLVRQTKFIDKGVWIIDNWSMNFYHWNSESLPRLISCLEYLEDHPVLLPSEFKGLKFVEESLEILGVKPLYFDRKVNYVVGELITVNKAGYVIDFQESAILKLREKIWSNFAFKKATRKIYISRENAAHRKVLNEKEVIKKLKSKGFEIVYFEHLTVREQIEIMMETKILVGLHGAGLVNMLYMPKNGKVLEFRNENDSWVLSQSFYSLASFLGHDYYYTDNEATRAQTGFADFKIDLEKLDRVLVDLLVEFE